MNMYLKRLRILGAAAALVPLAAAADPAITTQGVNMRAGPDTAYPRVAFIARGVPVDVVGCVEGWRWCDVIAGPNRGWVWAQNLSYRYANRPTIISNGGATLGIPLLSFSIAPYWDSYYRARPWYNNRDYWYGRYGGPHYQASGPRYNPPVRHDNGWHGNNPKRHNNPQVRNEPNYDPRMGSQYSAHSGPQ
jgi:uncharacterized protein YraI